MARMKPINAEVLMGHLTGISDSYYRAAEHEFLEDYLKAVDFLTIDDRGSIIKYRSYNIKCGARHEHDMSLKEVTIK